MADNIQPPPSNQTVTGDENIQVAGSNNIINRITNFFAEDTKYQRAQRNRRTMLGLVRKTWVKEVLEKSIYKEVLIELGMEKRPDAVDPLWDILLQISDQPPRTLPASILMIDIFDEANGALLILGGPGSGKTTMLLELARDAIARAEINSEEPIPVVFNLSSWSEKQLSFTDWLIDELREKYLIPEKIAIPWLEDDNLLLLLDGLDEVPSNQRENCIKAINDFRQEHLVQLAICSRIADYENLTLKLKLNGAILIKELTSQQVDQYFEKLSINQLAVRESLGDDDAYHELTRSPLLLSILVNAYQEIQVSEFRSLTTIKAKRNYLFDTYVNKMIMRRGKKARYSLRETINCLAWLANNLSLHNQNIYRVEQMQPSWIPIHISRWFYFLLSRWIAIIIFIFGIELILIAGVPLWVVSSAILLLCALVAVSLVQKGENEIRVNQVYHWKWNRAIKGALIGIFLGIVVTFVLSQIGSLPGGRKICIRVFTIGGSLLTIDSIRKCFLLGRVIWSLLYTIIPGLIGMIVGGITSKTLGTPMSTNQGIWFTLRSGINISLIMGLLAALIAGSYFVLNTSFPKEMLATQAMMIIGLLLSKTLGIGLGISLFAFLWYGGQSLVRHYTLRLILVLAKVTPGNYISFLDYCVDRIFLRHVGGGYIFVHRLLMEHFAAMYPADEK